MKITLRVSLLIVLVTSLYVAVASMRSQAANPISNVPAGKPAATIDLGSVDGVKTVKGEWRYSDTKIVETDFRGPGPDKQPTGAPVKTYDYTPHAGVADFDDSKWEVISPTTLDQRRGKGRLGFNWYRIKLTIPERVGDFDPTGSTAVFETSLDDYAEIWVDGELSRALGQSGAGLYRIRLNIAGVRPETIQESDQPAIVRLDPRLDQIVPANAALEKIAGGYTWVEGPVWNRSGDYLLFSDVPSNRIIKWKAGERDSVFLQPSGYSGAQPFTGREPGSNGLTFDKEGRLVFCQHGDRRISRLEKNGTRTTLVDNYEGKRLNSPNDLVYKSNGDLYFTDPPYGLPKTFDDPEKELPFQGVYRLARDGKLTLLTTEVKAPNGIAFSPDEKKLYVSDSARKVWFVFDVKKDGTLSPGKVLFDGTEVSKGWPGAPDGLKVDVSGNIFSAAPGGVFILAPDGTLLGRFELGAPTGNCAWGEDGSTLFITSNTRVYRIRLRTRGVGAKVRGSGD